MNFSDFIRIHCDLSDQPCTFLLDTQADISVLKYTSVSENILINSSDFVDIKGVTNTSIRSLGSINSQLNINDHTLSQKLHIVPENFNIPSDGILGKDFLKNFQCTINYNDLTLTINTRRGKTIINILEGPDENTIVIPPRCEVIRHFSVQSRSSRARYVPNQELAPGVFTSNTIILPTQAFIRVLNTTNHTKIIDKTKLKTHDINKYDIYSFNEVKTDRTKKVLDIVTKNVPDYVKQDFSKLCSNFSQIFALEEDIMTVNNFYVQNIRVKDREPIYIKNYRLPYAQKSEIDRQVSIFLENGLIEPSVSDYNSPVLIVPKKTKGQWRMCIDYRQVNKKIIADKFPLPRIDDILDGLGRAKYFSVLDLFQGFHQIPLDEKSRDITSFSTAKGSYRWKVLPFGLNIAPNSFSRMMSIAFSGLTPMQCFLYMDDLIVIGSSEQHHLDNLKSVFETCKKYNLKLNPYKCNFFRPEVTYLGHRCTPSGVLPDDSKIETMKNYPIPNNKDSVKRFVAFANYYRKFIRNFASIAAPLNKLTRKKSTFVWTTECMHSFQELKNSLISPTLLQYPDFSKQFIITVDASKYGIGAILSQSQNDEDLPIAYASKSFTKGEANKSTIEQELIAIHFAIKHFRPYIYGTQFLVKSDHRPLVYLFGLKDPSSKLTRLRLDLEEYDFIIQHIKGKDNVGADALSRMSIDDFKDLHRNTAQVLVLTRAMTKRNLDKSTAELLDTDNDSNIDTIKVYHEIGSFKYNKIAQIKLLWKKDTIHSRIAVYLKGKVLAKFNLSMIINGKSSFENLFTLLETVADNHKINKMHIQSTDKIFEYISIENFKIIGNSILQKLTIIITNPVTHITNDDEKLAIIKQYHDDKIEGGHCGYKRLYAKIRSQYYWKDMSKSIATYVRQCHHCQINKTKIHTKEELTLTKTPQKPFDIVTIDTIGPFSMSEQGNTYAVTLICHLTKYLVSMPIPNKEAKTVAKALIDNFVLIYGPMREIVTDAGSEYKNKTLDELCQMLHIILLHSTAYHHETVGIIERNHRTLNEYLRTYLNETRSNWEENLKYFTYCYNITPNSSLDMKFTPFELLYGRKTNNLHIFSDNKIDPLYNIDNYSKELKYRLQIAHSIALNLINKTKVRVKKQYDTILNPIILQQGDKVLISNDGGHKLEKLYLGPYIVISVNDKNVEVLNEKDNKISIVHKNRLKKYISGTS